MGQGLRGRQRPLRLLFSMIRPLLLLSSTIRGDVGVASSSSGRCASSSHMLGRAIGAPRRLPARRPHLHSSSPFNSAPSSLNISPSLSLFKCRGSAPPPDAVLRVAPRSQSWEPAPRLQVLGIDVPCCLHPRQARLAAVEPELAKALQLRRRAIFFRRSSTSTSSPAPHLSLPLRPPPVVP